MLFIAVSSPNLADQHWESKKTGTCPNNETETYSPVTAILYLHCIYREVLAFSGDQRLFFANYLIRKAYIA